MEGIHIQFQWIPFQRDILKNMFYDWQAGEKGEFIKLRTFTCILCPVIIVKFPIVFEISRTKGANSSLSTELTERKRVKQIAYGVPSCMHYYTFIYACSLITSNNQSIT